MNIEQMVEMLEEFSEILAKHGRPGWSNVFRNKTDALRTASNSPEIREIYAGLIQSFAGGPGSLTDLVLHRNGKPLKTENNHFDFLMRSILDAAHQGLEELDQ